MEEVLVFTRVAPTSSAPPRLTDRPEDFVRNPVTCGVIIAPTNSGTRRPASAAEPKNPAVDEANPSRSPMRARRSATSTARDRTQRSRQRPCRDRFSWLIFLVAGDPEQPFTHFAGFDKSHVPTISCPDNGAGVHWTTPDHRVTAHPELAGDSPGHGQDPSAGRGGQADGRGLPRRCPGGGLASGGLDGNRRQGPAIRRNCAGGGRERRGPVARVEDTAAARAAAKGVDVEGGGRGGRACQRRVLGLDRSDLRPRSTHARGHSLR